MIYIIGLGNKARQGKDVVANILRNKVGGTIIHFADELKREVINIERKFPLVERTYTNNLYYYIIKYNNDTCIVLSEYVVPRLHEIFNSRNIDIYMGMEGNGNDQLKDSEMLQFWGTDWRRNMCSDRYWVDIVINKIESIIKNYTEDYIKNNNLFFIIPDVRFKNELECLREYQLKSKFIKFYFVKVQRINENGSQYIDPNRDPKHPSETELDSVDADFYITARSGDIQGLENKVDELINKIII